jgi:hypothetical protein
MSGFLWPPVGDLGGIRVLDHLIIGHGKYVSLVVRRLGGLQLRRVRVILVV